MLSLRQITARTCEEVLAVELAEKIGGGLMTFARIALEAAGNQVAIGIAALAELGYDVVEATGARPDAVETVEADAAVASLNGFAKKLGGEEVELLNIVRLQQSRGPVRQRGTWGTVVMQGGWGKGCSERRANEVRVKDFDQVAVSGSLDQADSAPLDEPAQCLSPGPLLTPGPRARPSACSSPSPAPPARLATPVSAPGADISCANSEDS